MTDILVGDGLTVDQKFLETLIPEEDELVEEEDTTDITNNIVCISSKLTACKPSRHCKLM